MLTPEKLKDLNGACESNFVLFAFGQGVFRQSNSDRVNSISFFFASAVSSFCVFSKLSVRVPGVFRLKMTLYETIGSVLLLFLRSRREETSSFLFGRRTRVRGAMSTPLRSSSVFSYLSYRAQVVKMASVLTDQFEVYSPKVRSSRRVPSLCSPRDEIFRSQDNPLIFLFFDNLTSEVHWDEGVDPSHSAFRPPRPQDQASSWIHRRQHRQDETSHFLFVDDAVGVL